MVKLIKDYQTFEKVQCLIQSAEVINKIGDK